MGPVVAAAGVEEGAEAVVEKEEVQVVVTVTTKVILITMTKRDLHQRVNQMVVAVVEVGGVISLHEGVGRVVMELGGVRLMLQQVHLLLRRQRLKLFLSLSRPSKRMTMPSLRVNLLT